MHRIALALVSLAALAACESEVTTSGPNGPSSTTSAASVSSTGATTGAGGSGGMPTTGGASGIEMIIDGEVRPPEHVTLEATASEFIGGINRWVFDFRWTYDDPMIDDEEERVDLSVRIMRIDPMFEPSETEASYTYPEDSGSPLEMLPGTYTLWGAFMQTTDIDPTTAAFSIRRVAGVFEGTVSIDAEAQSGPPYLVHVAGPFHTPVP